MRDMSHHDPKFKPSNAAVPFKFEPGSYVVKVEGDYNFAGVVLAAFRKRSGSPRYVVENEEGIVMIMNHNQLRLFDTPGLAK